MTSIKQLRFYGINRRRGKDVVGERLQTVGRPRKKKRLKAPQSFQCPHTVVARRSPPSAQGASEAVFLPVKKTAECTRAIRPRGKRTPQLCGARLPQAAVIQKIVCKHACICAEAAKGVRGKAKGFSPNGRLRPKGAGRGAAQPRRRALHLTWTDINRHEEPCGKSVWGLKSNGSGTWIRTRNQVVNSHLLYH